MKARPATTEDCERIARGMKVVVEEGRWLATERASLAELEERFRHAVSQEGHFLFVLEESPELVGALGMHPTPAKNVLSLGMWILSQWRRRGGGRMLVRAALAARPTDVHKIELEVFPDNLAAIGMARLFAPEARR